MTTVDGRTYDTQRMVRDKRRLSRDIVLPDITNEPRDVLQPSKVTKRNPLVEKVTNGASASEKQMRVTFDCDVKICNGGTTVPPRHTKVAQGENQGHVVKAKKSGKQKVKSTPFGGTRKKQQTFKVKRPKTASQARVLTDESSKDEPMDIDNPCLAIRAIFRRLPEEVTNIDDHNDLFLTPEYAQDIMTYMQAREKEFAVNENFLDRNAEVTSQMRAILIDWLIQVQTHEQLEDETVQLCVQLVDQFLSRAEVPLPRLQLLGITCLLVAAKYIERFPPLVDSLCALTANTYVAQEVLDMERQVLKCLGFDVSLPLPAFFLARYLGVHHHDAKVEHMARYLIDLSLPSFHLVPVAPSLLAASALCLTRKLLLSEETECWTAMLAFYSQYSEHDLLKSVRLLAKMLLRASESKYQGARSKHSDLAHRGISMDPFLVSHPVLLELTSEE